MERLEFALRATSIPILTAYFVLK